MSLPDNYISVLERLGQLFQRATSSDLNRPLDPSPALRAVALVFAWQSRRASSVTMLLLCALTWRTLPSTEGEAVTGVLLLIGGAAGRRRMTRKGRTAAIGRKRNGRFRACNAGTCRSFDLQ